MASTWFENLRSEITTADHQVALSNAAAAHRVVTVPILSDNYAYLIICETTKKAACVDPADARAVHDAAIREGVSELTHVLCTHNHWDHAGGNRDMLALRPDIIIVGGRGDGVDAVMREVGDGNVIHVGNLVFSVLFTPCHTPGHVTYVLEPPQGLPKVCFTGDTLFAGGCGNFNEGTPQQMYNAIVEKICALPDETLIYCGHEYTEKNLAFACHADPNNVVAADKLRWARERRGMGLPTVPSRVLEENLTNPFVRCRESSLMTFTGKNNAIDCLAELRRLKTSWKG